MRKLITVIAIVSLLSGCQIGFGLLGLDYVQEYKQPDETQPRAKALLVSDYSGFMTVVDFYVEGKSGREYLYANGRRVGGPSIKDLGLDVNTGNKVRYNQVYLPANASFSFTARTNSPGKIGTTVTCLLSTQFTPEANKEYVISLDKASESSCSLSIYQIVTTDTGKTLQPL
jgi:hypothetical protein